jgi:hypothetical protein
MPPAAKSNKNVNLFEKETLGTVAPEGGTTKLAKAITELRTGTQGFVLP